MANDERTSLDVLGIQPISKSIDRAAKGVLTGAGNFLSRICLPAAEEFGLLLRDRVSFWRANNASKIVAHAAELTKDHPEPMAAHPRVVAEVIEKGSWSDDDVVQKMWGGLLASSCTADGRDDGNVLFIALLSQLSSAQVRILGYACETASKYQSKSGLPIADDFVCSLATLKKVSAIKDVHRLDRELDHLRSLELIDGGLSTEKLTARINVMALALHLYVRGHGSQISPVAFWRLKKKKPSKQN